MRNLLPATVALLIPALCCTGCEGLDVSADAEGTGVQVIGAIVVLAKYQASQNQIAIAESKARRAYVDLALKPAYEARTRKLRKVVASGAGRPETKAVVAGPDPAALARAELATLTTSWKEAANRVTQGQYSGDFVVPELSGASSVAVNFPKLSESEVLAASASYVPRYLAVSVPAEQMVAGAKASVMLYDTQAKKLSSDTVYALDRVPATGKPTDIDRLKALYAVQ